MRKLQTWPNTEAPNTEYPYGRSRDNDGTNNGTPVNETTLGDMQQFFARAFDLSGLTANGFPDNAYNGWQLLEAIRVACKPYRSYTVNVSQTSTNDPTGRILEDQIGIASFTRQGVGDYLINKTAGFGTGNTAVICSGANLGTVKGARVSNNAVNIITKDLSGVASDGILLLTTIEVRVYYETGGVF